MIAAEALYQEFLKVGIKSFVGVPDSVLKSLIPHFDGSRHIVSANEGSALAIASGLHLSTGEIPLVYLQNSGLGNLVNPYLSLAAPAMNAIPTILLVGWRGYPELEDEPQHRQQGQVTVDLLRALGLPYRELKSLEEVAWSSQLAQESSCAVALLVRPGSLQGPSNVQASLASLPTRTQVIQDLVSVFSEDSIIVATTGKTGRELYEIRQKPRGLDFLNVGAMGHTSQIALGLALGAPERQVVCLDGDGSLLMHAGGAASVGALAPSNFKHIILNNGTHDSVGGQAVCAPKVDYRLLAQAFGYHHVPRIGDTEQSLNALKDTVGPALLELPIRGGSPPNLGRPSSTPGERAAFLKESLQRE